MPQILIGSDDSGHGAPGDELKTTYYQDGNRLIVEHWGRSREADPNEIVSELFLSLHALKDCSDPVDLSRKAKYDYLAKQIIARFNLLKWTATYGNRKEATVYGTTYQKAWEKAAKLGNLKSLH
jgi:hypothetical protein